MGMFGDGLKLLARFTAQRSGTCPRIRRSGWAFDCGGLDIITYDVVIQYIRYIYLVLLVTTSPYGVKVNVITWIVFWAFYLSSGYDDCFK